MSTDAIEELEQLLRAKSTELTEPRPDECLACFVVRMLSSFGCDNTLRWAARYRDLRAPRATRLEERLEQMGGYCDCELLLNGYGSVADDASLPRCVGVPRSSTKPCDLWQRHRRW